MRLSHLLLLAFMVVNVSGCGPEGGTSGTQDQAPVSSQEPVAVSPKPSAPEARKTGIWLEPATLKACARPEKIVVHWDASSFEGVKAVDLVAVSPEGKEAVFASVGRAGSRESGAWMRAGSRMILRDAATDTQLAEAVIGSEPCN